MATHIHTSPTVDERRVVHDDDASSSVGMIAVLLIAALLIIGFLLFAMRAFPFATTGTTGSDIDVSLPPAQNFVPDVVTPDVNVNQENTTPVDNNPVE